MSKQGLPIAEFPGYYATEDGKIYKQNNEKYDEVKPIATCSPYNLVRMKSADGKVRIISRARLIAETFLGTRSVEGQVARHKDGNKLNDAVENLQWGTRSTCLTDKQKNRRSTREMIKVALREGGKSCRQIAADLGVSKSTVYAASIEVRAEDAVRG